MKKPDENRTYKLHWSEKERHYEGLCDQYPNLSWSADDPAEAIAGIMRLVSEIDDSRTDEKLSKKSESVNNQAKIFPLKMGKMPVVGTGKMSFSHVCGSLEVKLMVEGSENVVEIATACLQLSQKLNEYES